MKGWDVLLDGEYVDTVFFGDDMSDAEVKRSLVDHDGYDSRIVIRSDAEETTTGGNTLPIMVDMWEVQELNGLVWGRLTTAEHNASPRSELPQAHQDAEAAEVPKLRALLERIRFIQRQLERMEVQR